MSTQNPQQTPFNTQMGDALRAALQNKTPKTQTQTKHKDTQSK